MNEYLSKEYIIKLLDAHLKDSSGAEHYAYDIIKREIVATPSVKHGKWIWKDFEGDGFCTLCCSECLDIDGAREDANYCSNCGADMR